MITRLTPGEARQPLYRAAGALTALLLGVALLTGCSGEGTNTQCGIGQCTVTFERGVNAQAKILGVGVKLVGVQGNKATIEVAGQQVTLLVDQQTQVGGFQVSLQEVTKQEVVVKISQGGGEGEGGGEGGEGGG